MTSPQWKIRVALAIFAGLLGVVGQASSQTVEVRKTPDGGIQPQAVIDAKGVIHLVYFKGEPAGGDVFYTRLGRDLQADVKPVRVNSQPGSAIAIGTMRGAQVALGRDGRVHVSWNGSSKAEPKNSDGSTPMLYSRSDRGGSTFEPQRNLMRRTFALDGGGSIAADARGNVFVAWHGRSEDSSDGEAGRRMWIARSENDGATFAPEQTAFDKPTGACGCCGTRALADAKGELFLLYRSASKEGTERDIYLLSSKDHGKRFDGRIVHPWKISACPMSSASLAEDRGKILAAWETNQRVYFAQIDPRTMKVSAPSEPSGKGGCKHPAIAANGQGKTILAWAEGTGWERGGALAWQVFGPNGAPTKSSGRIEDGIPVWGLPTVVARPDGSFVVIH